MTGCQWSFASYFFRSFRVPLGVPSLRSLWYDLIQPGRCATNKRRWWPYTTKAPWGKDGPIRPCYATLLLRGLEPHMLELWFGSDYKFSESVIRARTWSRWLPSSLRNCYITIYFIWCELIISDLCIVCFGAHQENPFLFRAPWHPSASWLSCAGEVWSP